MRCAAERPHLGRRNNPGCACPAFDAGPPGGRRARGGGSPARALRHRGAAPAGRPAAVAACGQRRRSGLRLAAVVGAARRCHHPVHHRNRHQRRPARPSPAGARAAGPCAAPLRAAGRAGLGRPLPRSLAAGCRVLPGERAMAEPAGGVPAPLGAHRPDQRPPVGTLGRCLGPCPRIRQPCAGRLRLRGGAVRRGCGAPARARGGPGAGLGRPEGRGACLAGRRRRGVGAVCPPRPLSALAGGQHPSGGRRHCPGRASPVGRPSSRPADRDRAAPCGARRGPGRRWPRAARRSLGAAPPAGGRCLGRRHAWASSVCCIAASPLCWWARDFPQEAGRTLGSRPGWAARSPPARAPPISTRRWAG